jgi:hypothetical protein
MSSGNTIDVFTCLQCQSIVHEFDLANKVLDTSEYSPNTNGVYNLPASIDHVDLVTDLVRQSLSAQKNIKFQNSFTREYLPGSFLKLHTDRADLDVTLSVCLEIPPDIVWPLNVSNVEWPGTAWNNALPDYTTWTSNYTEYNLQPGQGAVALGLKYPHWRNNIPPGLRRAVYVFYHWNIT